LGAAIIAAEFGVLFLCLSLPAFCFSKFLASSGKAANMVLLLHNSSLQSFSIFYLAFIGVKFGFSFRIALYIFGMYSLAVAIIGFCKLMIFNLNA
jgi:hypothetical protein